MSLVLCLVGGSGSAIVKKIPMQTVSSHTIGYKPYTYTVSYAPYACTVCYTPYTIVGRVETAVGLVVPILNQ